jgi:LEA14-like dessication related protein
MNRALLMMSVVAIGCQSAPEIKPVAAPTVSDETFTVVSQSLTQVDVKYTGAVTAGGEPITIERARWEFVVDGTVKRSGETQVGLTGKSGAPTTFELLQTLTYVADEAELKAMDEQRGALLLALRGTIFLQVGQSPNRVEVAFAKSREVRTPRLPHLKFIDFDAGRFSESEVQATFHVGVENPNPFQISLTGLEYEVELSGKQVAKATVAAGERISAASTGVFDVTATLNAETHGKAATQIVKGLLVPFVLKATLRAPLYVEEFEKRGDIKLKATK